MSHDFLLETEVGKLLRKAEEMRHRSNRLEWSLYIRHDSSMTEKRRHVLNFRKYVALPEIYSQLLKKLSEYGYQSRY